MKEEKVTINNIEMKHYLLKATVGTDGGSYISVYTFIIDGTPYIFNYSLSSSAYKKYGYISKMNEEDAQIVISQTETIAKAFIYTIRTLGNSEYNDYVNLFI